MTMPDFLVIGVAKSGTTSVYRYLAEHPQITMSAIKEPSFFEFGETDQSPPLNFAPYPFAIRTLADYQALYMNLPANVLCGEASPSNIEARACQRISRYLPAAKFICLLRQPVDRAYSAFAMHRKLGNEPINDFYRAYQESACRWEERFNGVVTFYAYRNAAWYVERLQDWFARFPRGQLHIGLYDDLKTDAIDYMRKVYAFLEVDDAFTPNVAQIHNRGSGIRSRSAVRFVRQNTPVKQWLRLWFPHPVRRKIACWVNRLNQSTLPPLDPQVRQELTLAQQEDILRLQELIGRDLTHWLV